MRIKLFGCYIDNLTMAETLQKIEEFIESTTPHQHVVVNVNKIIKVSKDENLKNIINNCDLINADGMPIVWASRSLGKPLKERVAGIDLFEKLLRKAENKNWKVYFLGATDSIVKKLIQILKERHPALKIAGFRNGYWSDREEIEVVKRIRDSSCDILFVGVSSPKKEIFLKKYLKDLNVPFVMGVGGAFDLLAGKVKRAPGWMQNAGMEWFYRFLKEPRRLFRRYFVEGPHFLNLFFKELLFSKYK